jgi:hypothetical protein
MRYLKKYKLFETSKITQEFQDEISDILLELQDEGFFTVVKSPADSDSKVPGKMDKYFTEVSDMSIEIIVYKDYKVDFKYSEIEDVFNRIIDYLTPYQFKYFIFYLSEYYSYQFININEIPDIKGKISSPESLAYKIILYKKLL